MRRPLFRLITSSAAARDPNMFTLGLDCVQAVPQLWRIWGRPKMRQKRNTFVPPIALLFTRQVMFTALLVTARQDTKRYWGGLK